MGYSKKSRLRGFFFPRALLCQCLLSFLCPSIILRLVAHKHF